MSTEAPNSGMVEPTPTPVSPEKKDVTSPENPSEVNGNAASAPEASAAEQEARSESPNAAEDKPSDEDKPTGEKRDQATANDEDDKPADEEAEGEPSAKKQKVENEKPAKEVADGSAEKPTEEPAPSSNGVKRGPGRPKKGESTAPKKKQTPRSTEGIGSRTRSRAKA